MWRARGGGCGGSGCGGVADGEEAMVLWLRAEEEWGMEEGMTGWRRREGDVVAAERAEEMAVEGRMTERGVEE